jgi:hypothetical protein
MKKIIIRVLIVMAVLLILAVIAMGMFLDKGIKAAITTGGPILTKTDVKLDSVSLSILSGSGKVKGLVIGNPEGFKAPSSISMGSAELAIKPGSILSDKVIVKTVKVEAPDITFELDLKGNNISKLLDNVKQTTAGLEGGSKPKESGKSAEPAKPGKKLQVDEFVISDGKIHLDLTLLGGKGATVPLPTITLTNLGAGPDGITGAELFKVVLTEIEKQAVPTATKAAAGLTKDVGNLGKDAASAAEKAAKRIENLFKKQ